MASRGANPMTITVMIILVMATIVFTAFFIRASNSITMTIEGTPEDGTRKTAFDKVAEEVATLRSQAEQYRQQIEIREREIERLEVALTRQGVAFAGDVQIAGADGGALTFNGVNYTAKQTNWAMALHEINQIKERLVHAKERLEARARDVAAPLEDQIDARSREQQQVLARANEMDAEYRQDEEKLLAIKDEIEKRKSAAEKAKQMDFGVRSTDINTKEERIRSLLEIELRWLKELTADGNILETVPSSQTAIIDIGTKDSVFAGLLLDIFQHEKGRYIPKGRLEVVDVQNTVAVCRILEETDKRSRPIAPGDFVGNPVFDKDKSPVFVLAGEFKQYNTEDLANFIRAAGGTVADSLAPGCDYLVAGDHSEKIQDVAREYQLVAMTEDQLLRYVRPAFSVNSAK